MRTVVVLLLVLGSAACIGNQAAPLTGDGPVPVVDEDAVALRAGDAVEGVLSEDRRRQSHLLELGEGQRVVVAMEALEADLDPYLRIYDETGALVTEDDDGGDGRDSLARVRATRPATFTVEAGSFVDASTGRFRLSVRSEESALSALPDPQSTVLVRTGELGPELPGDARYTFEGTAGRTVRISVETLDGDLDPVVELLGPLDERIGRDDDGGEGRNSLLRTRLERTGTHTAVVTTFSPTQQAGTFRIVVSVPQRAGTLEGPPRPSDRPLSSGR